MKPVLVLLVLAAVAGTSFGQNLKITLAGRNLKPGDAIWGPPDPYIKVSYAMGGNAFTLVGKTITLHTENPVWTETFNFQYVEALNQRLQFEVIENDAFQDDHYGTVELTMKQVLDAPGRVLERDFGKGVLIIRNVN